MENINKLLDLVDKREGKTCNLNYLGEFVSAAVKAAPEIEALIKENRGFREKVEFLEEQNESLIDDLYNTNKTKDLL